VSNYKPFSSLYHTNNRLERGVDLVKIWMESPLSQDGCKDWELFGDAWSIGLKNTGNTSSMVKAVLYCQPCVLLFAYEWYPNKPIHKFPGPFPQARVYSSWPVRK
jgi:hypothetical protein